MSRPIGILTYRNLTKYNDSIQNNDVPIKVPIGTPFKKRNVPIGINLLG